MNDTGMMLVRVILLVPACSAALLAWLTSEENTGVCGQTIYIDGGSDVVLRGDDVWSWNDPVAQAVAAG